jgi:tRNA(Ile)-lysidine synthase
MAPRGRTEAQADDFLLGQLLDCPELLQARHIVLGFSGGLDSTVLLHLLATLRGQGRLAGELCALHVHHGLQPQADVWLEHCKAHAETLGVVFAARRVRVSAAPGDSPEAAAREARYEAFEAFLPAEAALVLAHHADDQVETVLLHLLRGSGPRGLAGMPRQRVLGAGQLLRPLLGASRIQILQYAQQHQLEWIEDPSNGDSRYTRNLLRNDLVPALQAKIPHLPKGVLRSAGLQAEAEELLGELAAGDLAAAQGEQRNQLQLPTLAQWSPARVRNLLRLWVRGLQAELGGCDITHQALQHCVEQLIPARDDAAPVIAWGEPALRLELRRFRDCLFLVKPMPALPEVLPWKPECALELPGVLGALRCETGEGTAPSPGSWPALEVRFRRGGERLQQAGRPTRSLKHLLQEAGVPPWLRPCVPLVYCDGVLLAAGDLFVQELWPAQVPDNKARFLWDRKHLHCGW